jgi:Phosphotransferase System HPr (HPr) Family
MIKAEFTITFAEGLHARPASELVRICQKAKSEVQIQKDDMTANPKSILGIMALGAAKGDVIKVEVDGEDQEEVFANLKKFFEA